MYRCIYRQIDRYIVGYTYRQLDSYIQIIDRQIDKCKTITNQKLITTYHGYVQIESQIIKQIDRELTREKLKTDILA